MGDGIPHTPCEHERRLFGSTDLDQHTKAAALCRTCPVFGLCRHNLRTGPHPTYTGTWAAQLVVRGFVIGSDVRVVS